MSDPEERPHQPSAAPARAAAPRRRLRFIATGVVAVAAIVAVVVIATRNEPRATQEALRAVTTTPSPSAETTAAPEPSPEAAIAPGALVVSPAGESLAVYPAAGDAEPSESLGQWTALGASTTLLGFATETVGDAEWIQVELPGAPNHREGWVRADDVQTSATDVRIDIYLDERELDLTDGGTVELTSEVVIGADESPTPLGVFWVTDPLDFSANDSGVYGSFAMGLNGWSEALSEFNGGVPQIAVHGTNQPELMGQAVSNGCIRVPNDIATALGAVAAPGTPVVIHQSRSA
ncbi:L,D-transpeptidase [Demequina sp. NBRC 110053]|uniref:L,D-transpeptidase n=1 Tax=Demequina sp. NBRC 110053 TaxID=1570342 RepID=UPI001356672D|nr:L,D-transpeptidase [Demequina sp. NBRC 110053]